MRLTSTYTKTVVFALALLIGPAVSSAYAITIRDLVALSKEGVSDAVLIALIETDGSRFQITADDVRSVRAQGLSDAVIVAMIRTRPILPPKEPAAVPAAPAPVPPPEPIAPPAPPQPVIVQAPPVNVTQTVTQRVEVPYERPRQVEQVPVYVPVYVPVPTRPVEVKKEEPVYWGWGGKRRPDAWPEPVIIK
jgi:hypothetical protein